MRNATGARVCPNGGSLLPALCIVMLAAACASDPVGVERPRTLPLIVSESLKVFSVAATTAIRRVSVDQNQIVATRRGTTLDSLRPGDIVVADASMVTPNGLLRRVMTTSSQGDSVVVITEPASLTEAIKQGRIQLSADLAAQQLVRVDALRPGVTSGSTPMAAPEVSVELTGVVLFDEDGNSRTTTDQVVANGRIAFAPKFDLQIDLADGGVSSVDLEVGGSLEHDVRISSTVARAGFAGEVQLARYIFQPLTVWVGIVPVVFVPVATINAGAQGEISVGIETGASAKFGVTAGLRLQRGTWSTRGTATHAFNAYAPRVSANAAFRGYARAPLELLVYGVVGPYSALTAYYQFNASSTANPWWSHAVGVEAAAGFALSVLGKNLQRVDYPGLVAVALPLGNSGGPKPATGSLSIDINGLPSDVAPDVTVTGPNAYRAQVSRSTVLSDLASGSYFVAAAPVRDCDINFAPSPASAQFSVTGSSQARATVSYSAQNLSGLSIGVTPQGSTTLASGESATYTAVVLDCKGQPSQGAFVGVADPVAGASGVAVPTNSSGVATYTLTVPVNRSSGSYTLTFQASKTGFASSPPLTRAVTVSVSSTPSATLSANPESIAFGQSSTLMWSSTNATSCTGSWSGSTLGTSGTATVSPTQTTTYSLTCSGSHPTTATVTVAAAPRLSITTIALAPGTATVGVAYVAQQSITASGGRAPYSWSISGQPNGISINPSTGTLAGTPTVAGTFNITATVRDASSPQLTASKVFALTVTPGAGVAAASLSAVPTSITSGMVSTLTWSSTNATSCTGSWSGSTLGTSGTAPVLPTQTTTYSITCSGSSPATATVTVTAAAVPTITQVSPATMPASLTALNTLTVTGTNFSTSNGSLQFFDPLGNVYYSTSNPQRIVSVTPTQWVYRINNGGTRGTWQVRVINAGGVFSNFGSFVVQ